MSPVNSKTAELVARYFVGLTMFVGGAIWINSEVVTSRLTNTDMHWTHLGGGLFVCFGGAYVLVPTLINQFLSLFADKFLERIGAIIRPSWARTRKDDPVKIDPPPVPTGEQPVPPKPMEGQ
jgi:hypothetical protein